MRPEKPYSKIQRRARFESFEDRLAMSAQPLSELGTALEDIKLEHHYGEITPVPVAGLPDFSLENLDRSPVGVHGETNRLGAADDLTGLTNVRNTYGLSGRGQTVAIIDSGIAYDHRALGGGFGQGSRVVGGWDFAENDANPYDDGPAGFHGTHVAGIVGSSDSNYKGVASGVDLVALRVFDDQGNGNFGWVEKALQWVHQHRGDFASPITTVNLSLGTSWNADSPPSWTTLEDEFAQLKADGIFIAVSAGNSFSTYNSAGLSYPAASSYVVPVSSVDNNGLLSNFSQRNSRVIAAPGRSIVSTVPDYLNGRDGIPNDFAAASGTSMAAPYLAGASALVRQTMTMLGYGDVTQDRIYNHLRNTADTVFDSVTNANYSRLNLNAAISSLIPTDDFGGTSSSAYALGTLTSSRSVGGMIGTLQDQDFFTFTAGYTGTANFSVQDRDDLSASLALVGGGGDPSNDALSFRVVAGQQYTVSLATVGGIGTYNATFAIQQAAESGSTSLGTIDFEEIANQNIQGERWYEFDSSRQGLLTIEAAFSHAGGNIDLELYDAQNKVIVASRSVGDGERIDVTATKGQSFRLKVSGSNTEVELGFTNLVTLDGNRVIVGGTAGNDDYGFVASSAHVVNVNGVTYSFSTSSVKKIEFSGGEGNDRLVVTGGSANETVTLRAGSINMKSTNYELQGSSVENTNVSAGSGKDIVYLYDSAGDDRLEARPASIVFAAADGSFANQAEGFDFAYAYAQSGRDQAFLYDSAGNDRFETTPTYALMQNTGSFYNYAQGFDEVKGFATSGSDTAHFYDSKGDDRFVGTSSTGHMTDVSGTFSNYGQDFDYVYAYSKNGGNDSVVLSDSAGNDVFTSLARSAQMRGAKNEYMVSAEGFREVEARSENGGMDLGYVNDVASTDKVVGERDELTVSRASGKSLLRGFAKNTATSAARSTATADIRAVDYVFQKIGKWN